MRGTMTAPSRSEIGNPMIYRRSGKSSPEETPLRLILFFSSTQLASGVFV
jgi:hypothetical protein